MKSVQTNVRQVICFLLVTCFLTTSTAWSAQTDLEYNGVFKQVEKPLDYMASEFKLAKSENKKLLFVLGGNWCHDSRSLAKKLDDPVLSQYINENYRLSMIDVGYLNRGFEFAEKAEMKTFYATPTVLIFDPVTEKLINSSDMHIWSNAFKIEQEEVNRYFKSYITSATTKQINLTTVQQQYLSKLDDFKKLQEDRIKSSYTTLGPMLERYKADDIDSNFKDYWSALAKLRTALPADIKTIKAKIIAASDKDIAEITFPEYQEFPWE